MPSLWIRVARVTLVFTLAGLLAGYGIVLGEPSLTAEEVLTHPWAYKSAISALLGSLAWAPLLSWPRLWGMARPDDESMERERRWVRLVGMLMAVLGVVGCMQSWIEIEDHGIARSELADNAEILEHWSINRESNGQETRYLWLQVEPVAPLPLVAGSITPAIPVLRPGARAMVGVLGRVVQSHAKNSARNRIEDLRDVLLTDGREAMEAELARGVGGTKVTISSISWLPVGELGTLPADPSGQVQGLEEGEISDIFYFNNGHQVVQRLDSRERYSDSILQLRGIFDSSGFTCLITSVFGILLLWYRRLGTAAVVLSIGVGAAGFALVDGPAAVTISVQNIPDGPYTPFVLNGSYTQFPAIGGICALVGAFAASFGASSAPRWVIRASKGMACLITGLATGLTGLYLFFTIWPPVEGVDPWNFFLLILVSYWNILVPVSCAGGAICATWNSRPSRKAVDLA